MLQKIEADLKTAMLAREQDTVTTLRGLKSAIRNVEIDSRKDLNEEESIAVLQKEAKKRREAIAMYEQANDSERADNEKRELAIIEQYLPEMADTATITTAVDDAITQTGATSMQDMGAVMGQVKQKLAGTADGAEVARIVKERLSA